MSYCRHAFWEDIGEETHGSDVYLYPHVDGFVQCCGCLLSPSAEEGGFRGNVNFDFKRGALAHLWQHRLAGHIVPQYAFDRLEREIVEEEVEESGKRMKKFNEELRKNRRK